VQQISACQAGVHGAPKRILVKGCHHINASIDAFTQGRAAHDFFSSWMENALPDTKAVNDIRIHMVLREEGLHCSQICACGGYRPRSVHFCRGTCGSRTWWEFFVIPIIAAPRAFGVFLFTMLVFTENQLVLASKPLLLPFLQKLQLLC